MRTAQLSVLALLLGASITFLIAFPARFLWTSYMHAGLW